MAVSKFFVGAYETANFAQVPHHITHNTSQHTTLHCTRSLNPPLTSPSFPYPSYPFLISHLPYETANFAQVTAHHTTHCTALHCTTIFVLLYPNPHHLTSPSLVTPLSRSYISPLPSYILYLSYISTSVVRGLYQGTHTPLSLKSPSLIPLSPPPLPCLSLISLPL